MPELPEVEVTRLGLAPELLGRRITGVQVREARLRWRVSPEVRTLPGRAVRGMKRRGKYLLLDCGNGHLILHLGMSGSLRVEAAGTPPGRHDHVDIEFGPRVLRLRDPRRFGAVLWTAGAAEAHPLIRNLGIEPLSATLTGKRLHAMTRGRRTSIKQFLMDGRMIVGVGNIYASESLHLAGISPRRRAGTLTQDRCAKLSAAVKTTLRAAIAAGGSTLRDFVGGDGRPGYFQTRYRVYDRAGEKCRRCATPVRRLVQGQRASFYCPSCQR